MYILLYEDVYFHLGKPKPDPDHTSNTTFKPRLGNTVTLSIHVISYPPPSFVWVHNDEHISSVDTNQSSAVELKNFEVNDFGKYLLNVSNEVGSFFRMYEILADGKKYFCYYNISLFQSLSN
jgi:hypothetical protein